MLSDERIAELAEKYYSPISNTKHIEQAIRDALAEAAVCSQFKPGESGQVWEAAQVPVMGQPGDWRIDTSAGRPILVYNDCSVIETEQAEYVLNLIKSDDALSSITQAELDAKDARISELEFVIEEIIRINHYDFLGHEIAHAAIAQENGK